MKTTLKTFLFSTVALGGIAHAAEGTFDRSWTLLLTKSAASPSNEELIQRSELLEAQGFYHLGLSERVGLLKTTANSPAIAARAAELALSLDRLDDLAVAVRADSLPASAPPALRAAIGLYEARLGRNTAADSAFANLAPQSLRTIANPQARTTALLGLGSWALQNGNADLAANAYSQMGDAGLAHLQRARVRFGQKRYELALEDLSQLPKSSPSWYPGLMVAAWSAYQLKDYNLALGQLMTVHSPFLAGKLNPEASLLEAASFYRFCYFESSKRSLERLRKRYQPLLGVMDRFSRQYGNRYAMVSQVLNFARGVKAPEGYNATEWELLMDGLLQVEALPSIDRSLGQVRREERKLPSLFSDLPESRATRALQAAYKNELDRSKREYYRRALRLLSNRLSDMRTEIMTSMEGALAIDVEINTRIRERLLLGKTPSQKEVDFEAQIRKGFEFWPFQGEYWRDETGGYAFITTDVCSEGHGT